MKGWLLITSLLVLLCPLVSGQDNAVVVSSSALFQGKQNAHYPRVDRVVKDTNDYFLAEGLVASLFSVEADYVMASNESISTQVVDSMVDDELSSSEQVNPYITFGVDNISYNVADDPDAAESNLLEMIKKVPLITVDGDDLIRVKGNSSFHIYVNGKLNTMMTNNPSEVLRNMPANTIKRVEVITNPGAKYEAESSSEVINIETLGNSTLTGYNLTLNASVFNIRQAGGVAGTVALGKFTLTANYTYSHNQGRASSTFGNMLNKGEASDNAYDKFYNGKSNRHGDFQFGNLEASYEIDDKRLLSANFGFWLSDNTTKGYNDYEGFASSMVDSANLFTYRNDFTNVNEIGRASCRDRV